MPNRCFTKITNITKAINPEIALPVNKIRYPNICETNPSKIAPSPIPKSNAVKNEALATPLLLGGTIVSIVACKAGCAEPNPTPYNAAR